MFGEDMPIGEDRLTFTRWLGGREWQAALDPPAYPRQGWTGRVGGLRTPERATAALAADDLGRALVNLAEGRAGHVAGLAPARLCLDAAHSDAALHQPYLRQRALLETALYPPPRPDPTRPAWAALTLWAARLAALRPLCTGHPLADLRLVAEIDILTALLADR